MFKDTGLRPKRFYIFVLIYPFSHAVGDVFSVFQNVPFLSHLFSLVEKPALFYSLQEDFSAVFLFWDLCVSYVPWGLICTQYWLSMWAFSSLLLINCLFALGPQSRLRAPWDPELCHASIFTGACLPADIGIWVSSLTGYLLVFQWPKEFLGPLHWQCLVQCIVYWKVLSLSDY